MKGRVIVLDTLGGRPAAAMMLDGRLDDLLVSPPEDEPRPGAVYRATLDRPMKGQGGVTVRLPEGRGFLRQIKGVRPGQPVLVQVTGYAEDGKAVPVTTRVLFKSRYAIVTPDAPGINISRSIKDEERRVRLMEIADELREGLPEGAGLILRSSCESGADDDVAADIAAMTDLAAKVLADEAGEPELLVEGPDPHELAWRDWPEPDLLHTDPGGFEAHGVLDAVDALRSGRMELPGGGFAFVEPTRALVAVDVNTGGDTSLAAGLKANIALARALPAVLRCRGLGGQITLDVAPMPKKERRTFEQVIGAAFRADPVDTVLAGWTPLGHYELQRKRDRLPLDRCPI
ncbi:ribonuclease E/G [Tranquillimonas alkanivorans]|uniref:Ribonuclease G or E n=1 Tax=Tranquillimonas alkanivorans TaxID=441119 RepID=A0A1I5T5D4_9RHOB|nr:ribonuclease E/G [Tranquillimonas alkanivorans]SFP78223.1 Ribonuclease G or E [Tranquillimonas alkanivorans]